MSSCNVHGAHHDAFVSYRRSDGEDLVAHVANELERLEVTAFWDLTCLSAGDFSPQLDAAIIAGSRVLVPVLTPDYVRLRKGHDIKNDYCRRELEAAISSGKPIIPVMKSSHKDACFKVLEELKDDDPVHKAMQNNILFIDNPRFVEDMTKLAAWIRSNLGELNGETADERHFVNNFFDFDKINLEKLRTLEGQIHSEAERRIGSLVKTLLPHAQRQQLTSEGKGREDFTLYTGAAGIALALHACAHHFNSLAIEDKAQLCERESYRALEHAMELAKEQENTTCSFYCGVAGLHALATMMFGRTDSEKAASHADQLVRMVPMAVASPEAELLYGQAGFLYSLLVARRHVPAAKHPPALKDALVQVFDSLVKLGTTSHLVQPLELTTPVQEKWSLLSSLSLRQGSSPAASSSTSPVPSLSTVAIENTGPSTPLAYHFPAAHGGPAFIGAAHGLAGVLYVLLHLPELCLLPKNRPLIEGALKFIVSIQDEHGNFPLAIELLDYGLVHWCHGAPGVIPTLCRAFEVFGDPIYLDSAKRAAELVWKRGLLRKGTGVCHGISGSMLSLLTIYRTTHERKYLYRALRMCEATWFEPCLKIIRETDDPQRKVKGVPDAPHSLMEGSAGLLYAYLSIQHPDRSSFPGYDGAT